MTGLGNAAPSVTVRAAIVWKDSLTERNSVVPVATEIPMLW